MVYVVSSNFAQHLTIDNS